MHLRVVAISILLAMAPGCGGKSKTARTSPAAQRARVTSPQARELLGHVPATASAVVLIDTPAPFWNLVTSDWGKGPLWARYRDELDHDLRALFDERLGLDITQVHSALLYVGRLQAKEAAVLFTGVRGKLHGTASGSLVSMVLDTDDDVPVVAVQNGPLLVIGARTLAESIAREAPHTPAGVAADVLSHGNGAYVAVSVDLQALGPLLGKLGPIGGLTRATLSQGQALTLRVTGEEAALARVETLFETLLDVAVAKATEEKDKALSASTAEGVGALVAYHTMRYLAAELEPRREGKALIVDYPIGKDAAVFAVPAVGVLAGVAIPAFVKYIKKSKTAEARELLRHMADGARAYRAGGGKGPDGKPGFPASTGVTPAKGACCQNESSTCQPDPSMWSSPSWQALQFSVDDPFYYSYELVNDGQTFHARAYGDLDCDGEYSTFEITGSADATGTDEVVEHAPLE